MLEKNDAVFKALDLNKVGRSVLACRAQPSSSSPSPVFRFLHPSHAITHRGTVGPTFRRLDLISLSISSLSIHRSTPSLSSL
ncbi:hypothetical protein Droror1_Dr00006107 [Drosera rotundifolia]